MEPGNDNNDNNDGDGTDFLQALHTALNSNGLLGICPEEWMEHHLVLAPTSDSMFLTFYKDKFDKPISIELYLYFQLWYTVPLCTFSDDDPTPGEPE